jgi:4-carboxymuconolactone decarboxylase
MSNHADSQSLDEIQKRLTQRDSMPLGGDTPVTRASRDFLFAKVWTSDLSWREKRLISLTCTAIAGQRMPFETHVRAALESGDFSLDELHAFALHVAAYAGFPVGAGAEMMIQSVLTEGEKP